jgi:hypothetical protein
VGAWNPYIYSLGNAVALCDPTGLSFLSVLAAIGIALVVAFLVVASIYTSAAVVFRISPQLKHGPWV